MLSRVLAASDSQRIDSTFFAKEFLSAKVSKNCFLLSHLCDIKSGTTPVDRDETLNEGVVLLKTDSIRNGIVHFSSAQDFFFIDAKTDKKMNATSLKRGDVLINIVGATTDVIGRCAILAESFPNANITQAMALLRIKKDFERILTPQYVFAYLSSNCGHQQVRRIARPTGQFNMNLQEVGSFTIPILGMRLQSAIGKSMALSEGLHAKALASYLKAEALLLKNLGLLNFSPSLDSLNIKSFKDSFARTGRLDAEYYQPKYEQIMKKIIVQAHSCLIELVSIKKSIEPGSDAYCDEVGLPFLRVADYSKHGLTRPQKYLHAAFVAENRNELDALKPKKNTILFSKDGSVGEAYCLREDANFITSGAVLHLTVRDINKVLPDYLTLVLNSVLVRMQAERDSGGSVILHWRVGEIENVFVPLLDMPTQIKIAALAQQSFTLKAQNERLLEAAKRAVEIAIEQDEAAGMAYLSREISI